MIGRLMSVVTVVAALAVAGAAEAGDYILRVRSDADADVLCRRYSLTDVRLLGRQGPGEICLVSPPAGNPADEAALVAAVAADPLTLGIEPDGRQVLIEVASGAGTLAQSTAAILEGSGTAAPVLFFGDLVPPQYPLQPATTLINLSAARGLATGAGIVAVIDTGVDPGHPALSAALVTGYDFIADVPGLPSDTAELGQSTAAILEAAPDPSTAAAAILNQSTAAILEQSTAAILENAPLPAAFGHGTMVAGLVHLVAPTALIMPLKAFRADGSAALSDLVGAVYYAVDHGATVINMSFTLAQPSPALNDALAHAASRGVLCVAAAGNDGGPMVGMPAALPNVVAVASTTPADSRSAFSNYGSRIDVSAPGEALFTTFPGNRYAAAWGTSFSAALVSGAAALLHQYQPVLDESQAMKALEEGARVPSYLGKARLDLPRALRELISLIYHQ